MVNKKGVIEVQFNWIFVLIIGAIILLFFSVIILRQKDISEISTSDLILKNLEAIFSGAEVSLGTVNSVNIPKIKIDFSCNEYRIGKVPRQINVMSMFTPKSIESSKLITWTLDWSLPYRVTNLLYLTSPQIRYVFVGDSDFTKNIFNSMPNETKRDIYNGVGGIKNKGDNQVRIVFFDNYAGNGASIPSDFEDMKKGAISALNVVDNGAKEDKGTLEFFDIVDNKFSNKQTSYYIRKSTLLGAIFADDFEIYECVMKNSFKKLNIISQVYEDKTNDLSDFYSSQGNPACTSPHDEASGIINNIKTASGSFNSANVNSIDSYAKSLESKNKDAQLSSCAMIY